MRRVDRASVAEPAILQKPFKDGRTEFDRAAAHYAGGSAGSYEFARYSDASVKQALETLFHGKCAYCESAYSNVHPVDVEHYRPKSAVEGVRNHRGYWWLGMQWDNLLPSCIDCNRRRDQKVPVPTEATAEPFFMPGAMDPSQSLLAGKATLFPLARESFRATEIDRNIDSEERLLLDPTRDDPRLHLRFYVDRSRLVGLVYPAGETAILPNPQVNLSDLALAAARAGVSAMGAVSIQVYGLNRLGLVQARTRHLRDLEFLYKLSVELAELSAEFGEAIAMRKARLAKLPAARAKTAGKDIETDEKVCKRLEEFATEIRSKLKELMDPKAPYSELSGAWLRVLLRDA
ncbi:endonuclease [Mesorhizobium sp. L2C054A000]|nr:endonuclease [Mesorhizobium sp. L2C054A000]